jgi:ABC-type phosphate transport system substrate-binding protein
LLKRRLQEGAVIPKVVGNSEEILKAVRETPGAIGYVHESEVGTMLGLKVVATVPTK